MKHAPPPPVFQAASLEGIPGLKHGFFGRRGGVSEGPYHSLNCATTGGDDADHVAENRVRACAALDVWAPGLVTVAQVHGIHASVVTKPWGGDKSPKADALVAYEPGVALGLLTADCAPVLLVDPQAKVIGAAHAGWRGALGGVLGSVVTAMENVAASRKNIIAAIGPAIGPGSYEVGPEFPVPFLEQDPANDAFFSDASGQLRFDLPGYIAARLRAHGIRTLDLGHDTCAEDAKFFSYRRTTKAGNSACGRQLSVICLE